MPGRSDMRRQGSITVFASLLFMLVASLLFSLLEGARVTMLGAYADMATELSVESVFAEYQPCLWEDYQLLCLDGAYGGSAFSEDYAAGVLGSRVRENLRQEGDGGRMMQLFCQSAVTEEYQLLTDGDGQVFLHCVAENMKKTLPQAAAQLLYERYVGGQAVGEESHVEESILDAKQALADAAEQENDGEKDGGRESSGQSAVQKSGSRAVPVETPANAPSGANPLDAALASKQSLLLAQVLPDTAQLSVKSIDGGEFLEDRQLQRGNSTNIPRTGWYEKILAMEYADQHFSDFSVSGGDRVIDYELEYLVAGKNSDKENLEAVVVRILLMREAANVVHIMTDPDKRLMVSEMALGLAGVTVNAAVIKAVEYGLIGAWAYAESVLDVRALLCGDKIALVKSDAQWTSSLGNLAQLFAGSLRATDCANGWSYQDYLKGFLFLLREKTLAYRMMDMMEQNLRSIYLYRNSRMDHMISAADYTVDYGADTLFWKFSVLGQEEIGRLRYQTRQSFSYY